MFALRSTKRPRQDESDSEDKRYTKKSRQLSAQFLRNGSLNWPASSKLPVRPSPLTPSPPQALPALELATQTQSERSETDSPASVHEDAIHFSPRSRRSDFDGDHDMDMDMDMDMDDADFDIVGSPPPETSFLGGSFLAPMRPAKLDSSLFGRDSAGGNTGRIPTPLHPHFPAPRGPKHGSSMGGLGYPTSGMAGGMAGNGFLSAPSSSALQTPSATSTHAHTNHDRSRRMPSPITEDDDYPNTPTALTQSQLERLSVDEQMELESEELFMTPPPGVVTTPTTGRKRSGALSGRGRFTMGYRDDCDKCRQRVPGHYSHFLP